MEKSFCFAQFYAYNTTKNKQIRALGSTSVLKVDGRKTTYNQVQDVFDYLEKSKNVTKRFISFRIMYGNYYESKPKTPYIIIKK